MIVTVTPVSVFSTTGLQQSFHGNVVHHLVQDMLPVNENLSPVYGLLLLEEKLRVLTVRVSIQWFAAGEKKNLWIQLWELNKLFILQWLSVVTSKWIVKNYCLGKDDGFRHSESCDGGIVLELTAQILQGSGLGEECVPLAFLTPSCLCCFLCRFDPESPGGLPNGERSCLFMSKRLQIK